jgi:hypothetical protein
MLWKSPEVVLTLIPAPQSRIDWRQTGRYCLIASLNSRLICRVIDCLVASLIRRAIGRVIACLIILSCLFQSQSALALTKDDDIDTNRPSFMDSPITVPQGSLQFENGTLYQHFQHGINYYDLSETELRLGITKRTEFQMFVPQWVMFYTQASSLDSASSVLPSSSSFSTNSGSTFQNGVSDITEPGIKHQFGPFFKDLTVSVIGGVTIPTGRRLISGGGVQPVIRMPWSKGVTKNWSIMGMQSLLVIDGRDCQWQNFWMANRAIGKRTSIFLEYAGFYTNHAAPNNIAHFGVVRKLNKNTQIDTHFGIGLDRTAPAAFVGVGYSFRFDRLPVISKL